MTTTTPVTERDLHAYMDGQIEDSVHRATVEKYLAANPEEAERLRAYARIEEVLRNGVGAIAAEPVPGKLSAAVLRSRRRSYWPKVAAGIGWVALGAVIGWSIRGANLPQADPLHQALVMPALVAHTVYTPEVRHPVEVSAQEEKHLAAWLTKRLGAKVTIPPLQEAGFALVGGRLLPANDGSPAAQFMYEDDLGKRLTLYVRRMQHGDSQVAFRYDVREGVGVFYWIDTSFAYALSGELTRDQLLVAARVAYRALNP